MHCDNQQSNRELSRYIADLSDIYSTNSNTVILPLRTIDSSRDVDGLGRQFKSPTLSSIVLTRFPMNQNAYKILSCSP